MASTFAKAYSDAIKDRKYLRDRGWPSLPDGNLKQISELSIDELHGIAIIHAATLYAEAAKARGLEDHVNEVA